MFGSILGEATSFIGDAFHGIINFLQDPKQAISDFVDWAAGKLESIKQTFIGLGELISAKEEAAKAAERRAAVEDAKKEKESEGWAFIDTDNDGSTDWTVRKDSEAYQTYAKEHGLPLLAEGAVLEPNKPFLAVVGDQTRGTNVEAPLDTIKQALREELEQIVVNVVFNVNNDADRMYEIVKERSWTERQRTSAVQFG